MKIKRLFLLAVAALALASCVKKPISAPDPAQGGEPVPVSFSLNLGGRLTKAAPASSVFDNASGEFTLYAAAFSKSTGALISTSKIGGSGYQPVETVTAENANVVLTLSKAQDYKVVIFAMHAGAYEVNFADGNVATFAYKSDLKANDASLDAFYAAVDVSGSTKKYDVAMKRPFAQLNLLVPTNNIPEGQTTFSSSMKVEAPASFNLVTGAAGTDVQELVFADNAIAADAVGNYVNTHVWIGMNYVLVPASGTVTLTSFVESGMKEAVRIGVVPVRPNARTNIVGSIYSLTEFAFNLQIDSRFGDEQEELVEVGEDGDEGGGGGGTTPVTATLTVSPTSLDLTVGQSTTLTATTNSSATPTFSTSNGAVATVGTDGTVTAVAAGTATITVSVAAVEGAFTAASKTVPVTVTAGGGGETGNSVDATLTNAEILLATVDASIISSNPSFRDAEISSASGTWTANMAKHKDGLRYLQLRNKKGAYITSPLFSSAISKVEVTITSEDVTLGDRTLHAVPPTTTLPTGTDASGHDILYYVTEWANEYGCVRTGAEKGATVAIDFPEGSNVKQFMLIVEGGATYIDHIDVYY